MSVHNRAISHTRSRFDTYGLKRLVSYTIPEFLLPGDLAIVLSIGAISGLGLIRKVCVCKIVKHHSNREPRP